MMFGTPARQLAKYLQYPTNCPTHVLPCSPWSRVPSNLSLLVRKAYDTVPIEMSLFSKLLLVCAELRPTHSSKTSARYQSQDSDKLDPAGHDAAMKRKTTQATLMTVGEKFPERLWLAMCAPKKVGEKFAWKQYCNGNGSCFTPTISVPVVGLVSVALPTCQTTST
eukprot:2522308-Amphidinium_carterae.2